MLLSPQFSFVNRAIRACCRHRRRRCRINLKPCVFLCPGFGRVTDLLRRLCPIQLTAVGGVLGGFAADRLSTTVLE